MASAYADRRYSSPINNGVSKLEELQNPNNHRRHSNNNIDHPLYFAPSAAFAWLYGVVPRNCQVRKEIQSLTLTDRITFAIVAQRRTCGCGGCCRGSHINGSRVTIGIKSPVLSCGVDEFSPVV